jgi:serine/threonine protein kinase
LYAERAVLGEIDHPFILKMMAAVQTSKKLIFILEWLNGGDLFHHLDKKNVFDESKAKFYMAEMVLAIGHLHKRGVVYRDLKPENIMLDQDGHVKLADFGLAKLSVRAN